MVANTKISAPHSVKTSNPLTNSNKMRVIKLTMEQVEFLKGMSTQINDGENTWYYLPFWFKQVDEDKFEITQFEKLPEKVIDTIKDTRS